MIKKAFVEITNVCNLRCQFCPGTARPPAFLSEAGFARVLKELDGHAQCLYLHVMGEPLLHPLLGRFLEMAGEACLPVNLTTNGTLLGEKAGTLLPAPALRQVNVSLHSGTSRGAEDAYFESVLDFTRRAQAAGKIVALRLWNLKAGEEDGPTERALRRVAAEFGQEREALDDRGDGRGAKLAPGVFLNRAQEFAWPDPCGPDLGEEGSCRGLRDQVGILCDGTVTPCCLDGEGRIPLGNLFAEPLEAILSSPRSAAIAQGFGRGRVVEEFCRRCGYRLRFGGGSGRGVRPRSF